MKTYLFIYIPIAIWVFLDAKKRQYDGRPWAAFTALLGPLLVPFYLAKRPLKTGESREGGTAWNVLKYFAIFWTITLGASGFVGMVSASRAAHGYMNDYERAGAGVGMALGGAVIFGLWLFVLIGALVLGFFLRKPAEIERGPTGPLANP